MGVDSSIIAKNSKKCAEIDRHYNITEFHWSDHYNFKSDYDIAYDNLMDRNVGINATQLIELMNANILCWKARFNDGTCACCISGSSSC